MYRYSADQRQRTEVESSGRAEASWRPPSMCAIAAFLPRGFGQVAIGLEVFFDPARLEPRRRQRWGQAVLRALSK